MCLTRTPFAWMIAPAPECAGARIERRGSSAATRRCHLHWLTRALMLLNATSTDDFIELRGLKLATTVDAITSMLLPQKRLMFKSNGAQEKFLSRARDLVRTLGHEFNAMANVHTDDIDDWVEGLAQKTSELVRHSFRANIDEALGLLNVKCNDAEVDNVIKSRNELVHEARFVCQRAIVPNSWLYARPGEEYFAMLRFVDRIVLRTIGYRGAFLDRSTQDGATLIPADL